MNVEDRLAAAAETLRRSVGGASVTAWGRVVAWRRRRRLAAVTATAILAGVVGIVGARGLGGDRATRVATVDAEPKSSPGEEAPAARPPGGGDAHSEECRPPAPEPNDEHTMTVWFYVLCGGRPGFPDESQLVALPRRVPATKVALRSALEEYLKGITEEERRRGFRSFFPAEEDDLLVDVEVTEDGVAVIDFTEEFARLGNISTSTASESVLLTLGATVGQFSTVTDVVYRIEGEDENFCGYFELSEGCYQLYRPAK